MMAVGGGRWKAVGRKPSARSESNGVNVKALVGVLALELVRWVSTRSLVKIVGGDHFWQGEALDQMFIEVEKWINGVA